MAYTPPTIEPTSLYRGLTLAFTKTLADFPATDGWELTYAIRPLDSGAIFIMATADGAGFAVSVAAGTTSTWPTGQHAMIGYVVKATEKYIVYDGEISIRPNPADAQSVSFDNRSYLERILDQLEEVIEEGCVREVIRYSFNGVDTEVWNLMDALKARDYIKGQIANEEAMAAGRNRKILTRFRNAR